MRLQIGTRGSWAVRDYADASGIYSRERDASGEGASSFPDGTIHDASGALVARVSYNGRVWAPGLWKRGNVPLWDNREPVEAELPELPFGSTWRRNLYGVSSREANLIALRDGRVLDCTDAGERLDWARDGRPTDIIFWARVLDPSAITKGANE